MRIIEERHFSWQGLPGLPYGLPVPPTARGQFSTPSISALKNQGQKMSTIERATSLLLSTGSALGSAGAAAPPSNVANSRRLIASLPVQDKAS
jgi:hypothetical protein